MMESVKVTICRTCLTHVQSCKSLFATHDNTKMTFSEMLSACIGVSVDSSDDTPKVVCDTCAGELSAAWTFVNMARDSEERLRRFTEQKESIGITPMELSDLCKTEIKDEKFEPFSPASSYADILDDDELSLMPASDTDDKTLIKYKKVRKKKRKNTKSKRLRIKKESETEKDYKCPSCEYIAETECRFKKHLKALHPELITLLINYPCQTCGKNFKRLSDLRVHVRIHTGDKPFACDHCPMRFAQSGTLIEHKRNHTGETPFQCEVCDKPFSSRSSFWRHGRVHTKEKPYFCGQCGKAFSHSSTLKAHRLVHSEERPHVCNVCGKTTKSKYAMQQHMATHEEKHFVCEQCGKSFSLKSNLDSHKRKMHSERAGRCEICGKDTSDLTEHMVVHAGEPSFHCVLCGRAFRQKSSLSFHLALHRNADKFKCQVEGCTQAFPKANMLDFHVKKVHSNEISHVCQHCDKGFFRNSDLSRHLNSVHAVESQ